jgi:hypothetical protein
VRTFDCCSLPLAPCGLPSAGDLAPLGSPRLDEDDSSKKQALPRRSEFERLKVCLEQFK